MLETIQPGLIGERQVQVTPALTARSLGSGSLDVYATPALAALMEAAAVAALDPLLPAGQTSVGTALELRHVAATPTGMVVRARAEVTSVDERRVTFRIQAWDEHELIGEAMHTRVVVEAARFLARLEAKQPSQS